MIEIKKCREPGIVIIMAYLDEGMRTSGGEELY